jgi:hypothetical protein
LSIQIRELNLPAKSTDSGETVDCLEEV